MASENQQNETHGGDRVGKLVAVGRIRRAVGLDGRLEVEVYSGDLARIAVGTEFQADGDTVTVRQVSRGRKGLASVYFEGVGDRDAADRLRGLELKVPESTIPSPPDQTYYHYQLLDSKVIDLDGRQVGVVSGIMETGANDVYVVKVPGGKDVLVPATRSVIKDVDTLNRVITVDLLSDSSDRDDR